MYFTFYLQIFRLSYILSLTGSFRRESSNSAKQTLTVVVFGFIVALPPVPLWL